MPRGNTATIDLVAFRAEWLAHTPIAAMCVQFTVSKDQVIRLRRGLQLQPRNDRSLRHKPKHQRDPTPAEIRQRCLEVQATWDDRTRHDRAVIKPTKFTVRRIELHGEAAAEAPWLAEPDE